MPKMNDLGFKWNTEGPVQVATAENNKIEYPSVHISRNVPSEIMSKDVGHKCRLVIEVEIKSKSIDDTGKGKRQSVSLDILKMGYLSAAGKKSKDEYLSMSEKERDEYNKKDKGIE